ncbi:hypothetical protein NDU88_000664 [Pleurodeles waltl]|uniref:Uncharacterized protein n=1 Tax=Pleurodeles waltl TaxID=8319 RepID=A0AAV7UU12_PLEWA|nr:hypothetical protein NDU88_000664 [Pleurodeles waltl]
MEPRWDRAEQTEEKKTASAGNPDIRVPERLKRKEGIRARGAEGEEDAKEREARNAEQIDNGGNEEENNPYIGERRPFYGWKGDRAVPINPNPGGTWLQQVKNFPATLHVEARAEPRSEALCETASVETGNPDILISVNVPDEGRRAEQTEEEKTAGAGNPDIRVSERLKRKEGLRAQGAEGEEDAKEREAGNAEQIDNGGNEEENDPYIAERRPFDGQEDISRGQDSPNKPELRHVHGGTWLQQVIEFRTDGLVEDVNVIVWR